MPTHLYCLLSANDAASAATDADIDGIEGAPVRAIRLDSAAASGGMIAWVSTIGAERVPRDSAAISWVRWHDAVTQVALVRTSGVVPALLGDPYADDVACADALRARANELAELWSRANDMVEMTLILARQSFSPDPATDVRADEVGLNRKDSGPRAAETGPGRRYLEGRRSDDPAIGLADDIERVARQLATAVSAWTKDANTRGSPLTGQLSLSHLIARDDTTSYRAAVGRVTVPAMLRLVVDGPRAPYSFAALTPPEPGSAARF